MFWFQLVYLPGLRLGLWLWLGLLLLGTGLGLGYFWLGLRTRPDWILGAAIFFLFNVVW